MIIMINNNDDDCDADGVDDDCDNDYVINDSENDDFFWRWEKKVIHDLKVVA